MSIKYNSTSANVTEVKFNNNDVKQMVLNDDIVWCKPYSYSVASNLPGITGVTCTRYSTEEPTASTGTVTPASVSTSGPLFHGDVVYYTLTPATYYSAQPVYSEDNKQTITGNVEFTPAYYTFSRNTNTITVTVGSNVSSISVTYYNTSGTQDTHVFNASGYVTAQQGKAYSWTATPATGYLLDNNSGSGTVTTNFTIAPVATRISASFSQGTLPTGVSSLTCYRKAWNGSSWSAFTSGTIYYGDMFYWSVNPATYYNATVAYGSSSNYFTWEGTQGESVTSVELSGVNAARKTATITITVNTNISKITLTYYNTSGVQTTTDYTSSSSVVAQQGANYYSWTATAATGYSPDPASGGGNLSGAVTINPTATAGGYPVTITGTYCKSVYLSTSSTATSGSASGTNFSFGSTVYGFVELNDDTANYRYTPKSGWVQLGTSRKYRVGSLTVTTGTNSFSVSATRTLRGYVIQQYQRTGGTVYWSDSQITTSGGETTLYATYGSTVYWRIAANTGYNRPSTYYGNMTLNTTNFTCANDDTATYKGSAINNCTRISGTLSQGTLPTGIASLTCYRKPWDSNTWSTFASGTIYYGDKFYWSATPSTGYSASVTYGSTSNAYTWTGSQGASITSVATSGVSASILSYALNLSGTYCKSVYSSTTDGATSGFPSGTTYNYNTTVYYYAELNDDTAQYTYTPQEGWTLVSGRKYKVGSVTITGTTTESFSAVRSIAQYTLTLNGTNCKSVYSSTSDNVTSGNPSGTAYDYNTTVYYYATLKDDDLMHIYTAPSGWTLISGRTYRISSVAMTSNQTKSFSAVETDRKFTLTLNGTYCKSVYSSTSDSATSGNPSGYGYTPYTTVYYYAELNDDTSEYTYSAPSGWTLISGRKYKVGSVLLTGNSTQNFSAVRTEVPSIEVMLEEGEVYISDYLEYYLTFRGTPGACMYFDDGSGTPYEIGEFEQLSLDPNIGYLELSGKFVIGNPDYESGTQVMVQWLYDNSSCPIYAELNGEYSDTVYIEPSDINWQE